MLSGAKIGSAAIPIPVVGTFVGGVVGGVVGTEIGQRLGRAVINGATAFVETLTTPTSPAAETSEAT
jgi:phage tail tape-measure protein